MIRTGLMRGTAEFGARGVYRYRLTRVWDRGTPTVAWLMLNPSTATQVSDDNTIRRVIGFSQRWGYGVADVVNLFALRSRTPDDLMRCRDPVGPDNDEAITQTLSEADRVVVGWGNHGCLDNPLTGVARHHEVVELIHETGRKVICLGLTKEGQPRHPLYLPSDTAPIPFI